MRPSAQHRGYTSKWQAATDEFRRANPYCLGCTAVGDKSPSEVVDHIEPHKGNSKLFWNKRNWQPSCAWHHNKVKRLLENQWLQGQLPLGELRLDSMSAQMLTRKMRKPAIGADGWLMSCATYPP